MGGEDPAPTHGKTPPLRWEDLAPNDGKTPASDFEGWGFLV